MNTIPSSNHLQHYATQQTKVEKMKEMEQTKQSSAKGTSEDTIEISKEAKEAYNSQSLEKETLPSRTSTILNMSDAERAQLVAKMKEEQEKNMAKLLDFVKNTFSSQAATFAHTDDIWKFIASGEYTVDEQTRLEAQEAISEDGYYGVKQTSERIFEFTLALTGGDEELMRKMEIAVEDGFKAAEEAWGGKLPSITDETYNAVKQLFQDYYASLRGDDTETTDDES